MKKSGGDIENHQRLHVAHCAASCLITILAAALFAVYSLISLLRATRYLLSLSALNAHAQQHGISRQILSTSRLSPRIDDRSAALARNNVRTALARYTLYAAAQRARHAARHRAFLQRTVAYGVSSNLLGVAASSDINNVKSEKCGMALISVAAS